MFRLVEIRSDGTCAEPELLSTSIAKQIVAETVKFYATTGFTTPWVSYLGVRDGIVVGVCSFKGAPSENRVEIAYFTFPEFEGQGIASQMVRELTNLAHRHGSHITVQARTLPERGASHRVLEKNGFTPSGLVQDPEDGEVLEWVLR